MAFFDQARILQKARTSPFYLWLLNWSLGRLIPFNKPHRVKIVEINETLIKTGIPYRRSNLNHIRGLHACVLATLSEFTTGFMLISRLDMKSYRLIMKRIEMDYHYQGKMGVTAEFSATDEWINKSIKTPLQTNDAVIVPCEVKVHDTKGNHICTGLVMWQVKEWAKVKTQPG